MHPPTRPRLVWSLGFGIAVLGAVTLQLMAYWPGLLSSDAVIQYREATSGIFADWHPPAMAWIWRQLLSLLAGPAPMLLLQLLLYWSGFSLLAGWALRIGRPGLAIGLFASALLPLPFAFMGQIVKDSLMAGALITATGMLTWARLEEDHARRAWLWRGPAFLLLLFAAALRFNALPAALPLAVALLPARWRSGFRLAVSIAVAAIMLLAAMPLANRLIGANATEVGLTPVMFDLGGITRYSGTDVFPPIGVSDPVTVNRRCYDPKQWDVYAKWSRTPCPIHLELVRDTLKARHESGALWWMWAVSNHPLAYAEHRLAHFNINSRFLLHDQLNSIRKQSAPNPWGYLIVPGRAFIVVHKTARLSAYTPLGWPIWWISVALGVAILAPRMPSRDLILPIALSPLLYGLSFLVVSVSHDLRYHIWTMMASLLAAVLAAGDIAGGVKIERTRLMVAAAPIVAVTILCVLWRSPLFG